MTLLVRFFVRFFLRFKLIKLEKSIKKRGNILVISNHQSLLDPPIIGSFITELYLSVFAKAELFKVPVLRKVIILLNAFPVKRGEADIDALRKAITILKANGALMMFPEGTRTTDGKMGPFKRGVGYIASKAKCNVLPVYIKGFDRVIPKKGKLHFRWPMSMVVGEMIEYKEIKQDMKNEKNYTKISEYLYGKVKSLAREAKK